MILHWLAGFIFLAVCCSCQSLPAQRTAPIPAGEYVPFFDPEKKSVMVKSFELDVYPVTQGQFLSFVRENPEWRRSRVKSIFADPEYLKNWKSDLEVSLENSPVTYVSWFAAKAYCESKNQRLPTTDEWEYVGQASEIRADASSETENKARILEWYGKPIPDDLPDTGATYKNFFGVFDMHGLIWEWVFDFNAIPKSDGRASSVNLPQNLFCAGGVGFSGDPANYATFMRYAFRSSLKGTYTVKGLGFRCAQNSHD